MWQGPDLYALTNRMYCVVPFLEEIGRAKKTCPPNFDVSTRRTHCAKKFWEQCILAYEESPEAAAPFQRHLEDQHAFDHVLFMPHHLPRIARQLAADRMGADTAAAGFSDEDIDLAVGRGPRTGGAASSATSSRTHANDDDDDFFGTGGLWAAPTANKRRRRGE